MACWLEFEASGSLEFRLGWEKLCGCDGRVHVVWRFVFEMNGSCVFSGEIGGSECIVVLMCVVEFQPRVKYFVGLIRG